MAETPNTNKHASKGWAEPAKDIQLLVTDMAREMAMATASSRIPPGGGAPLQLGGGNRRVIGAGVRPVQARENPGQAVPQLTTSTMRGSIRQVPGLSSIGGPSPRASATSTTGGLLSMPSPAPPGARVTPVRTLNIPPPLHPSDCQNPQCVHCGSIIIPSPKSSFPIQDTPALSINHWNIYALKAPILNAQEITSMEDRLDFPVPEMIFGHNHILLQYTPPTGSPWELSFNCFDAIKDCDATSNLKVSYHKEWSSYRSSSTTTPSLTSQLLSSPGPSTDALQLSTVKPYDWTYSTRYKGSVASSGAQFVRCEEARIPMERLTRPDPILYFDEMVLYEDELADNGISIVSLKIRVMPTCLLLLLRFYLRIDLVIFRIRDTRVFIDLELNEVIREYKEQELAYDEVMRMARSDFKCSGDPGKLLRDPNWCSQAIPVLRVERERLQL